MMKTIFLILFCMAASSASAFAKMPGEVGEGGVLRDTPLYGFAGDYRTLSELRGKPLIINVWASWCGPCRAEMGSLERLSRRFNGKQFNIIGVSTDDHANAAAAFLRQAKVTFDNYHCWRAMPIAQTARSKLLGVKNVQKRCRTGNAADREWAGEFAQLGQSESRTHIGAQG